VHVSIVIDTECIHNFVRNLSQTTTSTCKVIGVYNVGGEIHRGDIDNSYMVGIPPKLPGVMRIVCISDTHECYQIQNIPDGDVLIHGGDFTMDGIPEKVLAFNNWLGKLPHKNKIVIAGNHDVTFDINYYNANWLTYHPEKYDSIKIKNLLTNCVYLEDSEVTIDGVRFYGSPWQPEYHNWAFNAVGEDIKKYWDLIPKGVDVLITHGPPLGYGGTCENGFDGGCPELLKTIIEIKPVLHVCGHIHEGYGASRKEDTYFINACSVNLNYKPVNRPIVVDLVRIKQPTENQ